MPGDEVDSGIGEELLVLRRDLGRELGTAQDRVGCDEADLAALLDEGGGELSDDASATDDHQMMTRLGQGTQFLVVTSGSEVENGVSVIVDARRGQAGDEQQFLVAENLT